MFFAPKEIMTETGESLVYNPHRTMVSKEFTFDAAHHLFRNHCTVRIVNQRLTCFFFDFFRCKEH